MHEKFIYNQEILDIARGMNKIYVLLSNLSIVEIE